MALPQVTIAIPFYNAERYIEEAVVSAVRQSYPNIELLLLDDGSTDNSLHIAKETAGKHCKCRVIQQENRGLSFARNRLVAESSGEYLFFLDADDVIAETAIEKLFELSQLHQSEMVFCAHYNIREDGTEKRKNNPKLISNMDQRSAYLEYLKHGYFKSFAWGKLFRRSIFTGISFPEGKNYEDMAVMPDLIFKCSNITYFSEELYGYRKTPTGLVGSSNASDLLDQIEALVSAGRHVASAEERDHYATLVTSHLGSMIRRKIPNFAHDANKRALEETIFKELDGLGVTSFLFNRRLKAKVRHRMAMWYFMFKFRALRTT